MTSRETPDPGPVAAADRRALLDLLARELHPPLDALRDQLRALADGGAAPDLSPLCDDLIGLTRAFVEAASRG